MRGPRGGRCARRLVADLWTVFACGAGLGFVARDLLGLPRAAVAVAWVLGVIVALPSAVRLGWKRRGSRICTAKGG
jgi:hypothetical protein